MWRVRLALAAAFTVVALIATALADDEPHAQPEVRDGKPVAGDPRDALVHQLADETASIDRALATVTDKLTTADTARAHRLAAAYRLLHVAGGDHMATARRRAAARLLVERDLGERRLLADEAAHLRGAATRTTADAARIAGLVLPEELGRPARGTIARRFGTLQHDRSKATLSRRGLDFEVEARAEVVALAAGTVRYAGPIRGLDAGVIIDHGSYLTIVAKLGEVAVPVGAPVSRGERLGRAARHRVYVEVRVKLGPGGLPIDPEPLFEKR